MEHETPKMLSEAQKEELQNLLDVTLMDDGHIVIFDMDLFDREVTIEVRAPIGLGEWGTHTIIFRGVQALLYQNTPQFPDSNTTHDSHHFIPVGWNWAGYDFYERPVIVRVTNPPPGMPDHSGVVMNFTLDLNWGGGVILIAASGVKIDDEDFYVGRPRSPSDDEIR